MTGRTDFTPSLSLARRQVVQEAAANFSVVAQPFTAEAAARATEVSSGYPSSKLVISEALASQQIMMADTFRELGLADAANRVEGHVLKATGEQYTGQRN